MKPFAINPRKITDKELEKLKAAKLGAS